MSLASSALAAATPTPPVTLQRPICSASAGNADSTGDSGLDMFAPVGTSIYAAASGTIEYSEYGHTPWQTSPDTPYSIRIRLDTPISCGGATRYYIW